MKKFLHAFAFLFVAACTYAQNTGVGTKIPGFLLTVKDSAGTSNGKGFAQVSPNGQIAVGTFVSNSSAYIQTHTNTDLKFATNDGSYQLVLQTGTGNLGIGSIVPTEKLDVGGNAKVRGRMQIIDGTQADGSVLTSDAAGIATWKTSPYGTKERFQFKLYVPTPGANGIPTGVLTTVYNTGTATGYGQGAANLGNDKSISVTVTKPGLYHFDWNAFSQGTIYDKSAVDYTIYTTTEIFRNTAYFTDDPETAFTDKRVSFQTSLDLYLTANQSVSFNVPFPSSSTSDRYQLIVTGHLIAE
ncbi:MAG: hypothetical protein V4722_06945 [Bacteroidota bacterium]